jgi:hypothetical protein
LARSSAIALAHSPPAAAPAHTTPASTTGPIGLPYPRLPGREGGVEAQAEISWSHNLIILETCHHQQQREFHMHMARRMGWTKNVLIHQLENQTHEKTLLNQTNSDQAQPRAHIAERRLQAAINLAAIYANR